MLIAELFDGTQLEFPEGTDPLVIENTVKRLTAERNPQGQPESGGIASFKSAIHDIVGQGALTLGKVGLMHPEEAQQKYEEHKEKSAGIFKPTEKGWTEDPITKTLELLGGSVPYVAAPLIGASVAPEAIGGALVGGTLLSGAQFVGSNLARQLDEGQKEGKNLADTSLTSASLAAIPQALLDTLSFKMMPGIRQIFKSVGKEITEQTAEQIAKKGIANTILQTGKTANVEGLTEAGQQVLERLQAGLNITDEEARKEYFDSYIGGAVLGGVLGTGGHFIEKTMQNTQENRYDSLMNDLRTHFDTASSVPMTDVIDKISDLTGEKDLDKIQNFLGGAQDRGHLETVPNEDDTLSVKFKQPTPIEQADDLQKNANPDIYKPEVFDSHADLYKAIVPKLKKFGLENVGVKIMDNIENGRADGLWANKIIHVAMDSSNPMGTMRHESVHALRELGGFKPNEWTVLSNKAKDEWVDKFIKKAGLYNQYKDQYEKDNGNLTGFDDYINEEAIAEAFKHFDQTKPPAGLVGNIYQRLKQFFETIRNGFQGNGFSTADSIFRSLEEGKRAPVALKEEAVAEGQLAPQYALKAPEGIPQNLFDAFGKVDDAEEIARRENYGFAKRNVTMASRRFSDAVAKHLIETGQMQPNEEPSDNRAWMQLTGDISSEYKKAKEQEIEQPSRYALKRDLTTREGIIADGIERLVASARKNKLKNLEERYAVGLARADTNLSKIEDGILQRLKDVGVSSERDAQGNREIDNVFYNQILPKVRGQLEKEQPSRYALKTEDVKKQVAPNAKKTNNWKATAYAKQLAKKYKEENGIAPYLSEGQIPVMVNPVKYSLKLEGKYGEDPSTGLPLNKNGTVTLYYPTTSNEARRINIEKKLFAQDKTEPRIYLTNESSGWKAMGGMGNMTQKTDGSVVRVEVDPNILQIDQTYNSGRKDFFIPVKEGDYFNRKMRLWAMYASRGEAIPSATKYSELGQNFGKGLSDYMNLSSQDKRVRLREVKAVLRKEHNIGKLLGENGKLEKTRVGDYGLTYDDKSVASLGLGLASAQRLNEKTSTCPVSAICEGLCLGDTSGNNQMYGGMAKEGYVKEGDQTSFRAGPRLSQYLKTEAMMVHPEEFVILLHEEINSFERWAEKNDYTPAIRLNVTSDIPPKYLKPIIDAHPNVMFYDYTKLDSTTVAPNHHLTYSSTGVSQVVNGEKIINTESNWERMKKVLSRGDNVAMAFTSKTDMPNFVKDEASGKVYKVWDGDNYDARFLDPKQENGEGMIVGLTNKASTLKAQTASKETKGFFIDYDKKRDGNTAVIKDQSIFEKPEKKVIPIKTQKFALRAPNTPAFRAWFKGSKIVDENGKPLPVYHGTKRDFSEFKSSYEDNLLFFSTNPKFASKWAVGTGGLRENSEENQKHYEQLKNLENALKEKYMSSSYDFNAPNWSEKYDTDRKKIKDEMFKQTGYQSSSDFEMNAGNQVMPVYLNIKNPFDPRIDYRKVENVLKQIPRMSKVAEQGLHKTGNWVVYENKEVINALKKLGYDGIWLSENANGPHETIAAFKPNQIKSAFNQKPTESNDIRYALRAPNTPEFKKWFRDSVIVNPDGTPKVMYHGTAQNIFEFRPKQANAIFVTEDPDFAESFSDSSEQYMAKEMRKNLTDNEDERLMKKATLLARKEGLALEDAYAEILKDRLPSRANIMPVFVRAENPFDYENPDHVFAVDNAYDHSMDSFPMQLIMNGAWKSIEDRDVQNAIKAAGFDAFYVREGGHKNLAVYEPTQLKSATGNIGTYDITKPDIRYSLPRLTKIEEVKSSGKMVRETANQVWDNIHNDDYLTGKRVEWIDKISGLTKALEGTKEKAGLPQFDMNGKLRADLLLRAKAQGINLIKNGIQSGMVRLNNDGTLGVERSENNLARSMVLADELDFKFKPFGFSGRGGVAEVARILRGEDILKDDAITNAKGNKLVAQANAHLDTAQKLKKLHKFELEYAKKLTKEAKALYNAGKLREGNLKTSEARRIYETNFYREILRETKEARKLMREGKPLQKVKRELQVTPEHIRWAHSMLDRIPEIENVLGIWKEVNRGLVDLWVDTGLLDTETAEKFKAKDRYVPLFKSREDLDNEGLFNPTSTGIKSTAKIHKLKGGTSERNIWENIDKHYAKMVAQAYENQTRRVGIEQLKYFQLAEMTTDRKKANILYKENGKEVMVIVENPNDLAAFQAMTYELSPLMKAFVPMTKVLRTGALLNPMYWIKQLIRDPIHASLVANSGIVTPFHSMVEFAQILAKNSNEAKILASRGVIGPVDNTLTMNEFLNQVGREKTEPHALAGALHKIMEIHEASDAATRVAIYKKAYAEGMKKYGDKEKATDFAVFKARESINFSVHGNSPVLQSLRASIPFFSAAITSLDTVYRAATGYGLNEEEKAQARRIFASRALMLTFMSTMYAMLYQDDEQYKKLPDYVKDENWLIPTPDGKTFIKIPTPYEIGFLFKTIPEGAVRYMSSTSTGKEVIASYYAGLLHNLPANGIPVPQAVKPILETITNHSFFTNHPIEGMSDQGLPVSMRGQRATEFSKMLSRFGLDGIGLSPAKIDNLIQGYFAELGTFSSGLASDVVNMAEGRTPPAKNIENMPFMKSFLTDPNVSKAVSDFYDLEANAKQMAGAINKFKGEGNIEGIQSILNDEEKKKAYISEAPLRKIGEEMTKVRKAINFYKENQGIDPEERRRKINELTQIYNQIAENGYTIANAIGINR